MLMYVKSPMKKSYHFIFKLDDLVETESELLEPETCFPDEGDNFRDVKSFLDQQNFEISNSVIKRLLEYAGRQNR
jgi:hypothetical protein